LWRGGSTPKEQRAMGRNPRGQKRTRKRCITDHPGNQDPGKGGAGVAMGAKTNNELGGGNCGAKDFRIRGMGRANRGGAVEVAKKKHKKNQNSKKRTSGFSHHGEAGEVGVGVSLKKSAWSRKHFKLPAHFGEGGAQVKGWEAPGQTCREGQQGGITEKKSILSHKEEREHF